jgi:hypothetical protein
MGSARSHEDDETSESGAHANITIDMFPVGKPPTDMSPLSRAAERETRPDVSSGSSGA